MSIVLRSVSMYYNGSFHVINRRKCFVGHNIKKDQPTIFAFRHKNHAVEVKSWLDVYEYDIQQLQDNKFLMKVSIPRKERIEDCIIESNGYYDTQMRMRLNNVTALVVDDIHVAKGNITLVNKYNYSIHLNQPTVTKEMCTTHLKHLYMIDEENVL